MWLNGKVHPGSTPAQKAKNRTSDPGLHLLPCLSSPWALPRLTAWEAASALATHPAQSTTSLLLGAHGSSFLGLSRLPCWRVCPLLPPLLLVGHIRTLHPFCKHVCWPRKPECWCHWLGFCLSAGGVPVLSPHCPLLPAASDRALPVPLCSLSRRAW